MAILSQSVLNVSEDDVWKFLVDVLVSASNKSPVGSFESEDLREMWENAFIDIIKKAYKRLQKTLHMYEGAVRRDRRIESNSLPLVLYGKQFSELPFPQRFEEDLIGFERFWIRTPNVSLTAFQSQVNANEPKFAFLSALNDEQVFESLKHFPALLEFMEHMFALAKKLETYKIQNIRHFLKTLPSDDCSKISESIHLYMNIWNEIVCPRMNTYQSIKLQFREQLSLESPLKYFLPTRNINSCCALVTMNFLITKNNELLEKYRRACRVEAQLVLNFLYINSQAFTLKTSNTQHGV